MPEVVQLPCIHNMCQKVCGHTLPCIRRIDSVANFKEEAEKYFCCTALEYSQEIHVTFWCPMRFEKYRLDHQVCLFQVGSYANAMVTTY
jgi:hypothetical protein